MRRDGTLPEPTCEGLALEVGTGATPTDRAHLLAADVVGRLLGRRWKLTGLSVGSRDFVATPPGDLALAEAWGLARVLEGDRDVASAEPIVVGPGLEPDETLVDRWLRPAERPAATRSATDRPLPCSTGHDWSLANVRQHEASTVPLPDHGHGRRHGEGILVGHPDTGFAWHPQLTGEAEAGRFRSAEGFDFLDNDPVAEDPLDGRFPGHGTGTASVIMSGIEPDPGAVRGVASLASLVPMRVSGSVVHLSFRNLAQAIHYAVDRGHHLLSMSLGGPLPARYLRRALRRAIDAGLIPLAAAGNVWPWVVYPARYPEVIAIGATNCRDEPWARSARGPAVDVSAPGESVWRARSRRGSPPTHDVHRGSGTSYAVATAAGACAVWLAHHGRDRLLATYGASELAAVFKELLVTTARRPPRWDARRHGAGILDLEALLRADLPATAPATGVRGVRAAPGPAGTLGLIGEYLPELPPEAVRVGVRHLLRAGDEELDALLDELGDELVFHVATNPGVRERIVAEAARKRARPAARGRRRAPDARWRRTASSALRDRTD